MNDPEDTRPTLLDLWTKHKFRVADIAAMTKLSDEIINGAICGIPTQSYVVEKVLSAVSALIHQEYTLETVRVRIAEEQQENKSEVARLMAAIDAEHEAARAGLQGLAQGKAKHEVITRHMENMGRYLDTLSQIASPDQFTEILHKLGKQQQQQQPGGVQ